MTPYRGRGMPDMPWKGVCVIMEAWCQMARIPSRMQQLTSSCALGAISSIVLVALVWASTTEILLNVLLGVIYFWVSFALREVKRIVCPLWWAVKRVVSLACRVAKRIGSPMCCLPMAWRGGSQQPVGWDVELGLAGRLLGGDDSQQALLSLMTPFETGAAVGGGVEGPAYNAAPTSAEMDTVHGLALSLDDSDATALNSVISELGLLEEGHVKLQECVACSGQSCCCNRNCKLELFFLGKDHPLWRTRRELLELKEEIKGGPPAHMEIAAEKRASVKRGRGGGELGGHVSLKKPALEGAAASGGEAASGDDWSEPGAGWASGSMDATAPVPLTFGAVSKGDLVVYQQSETSAPQLVVVDQIEPPMPGSGEAGLTVCILREERTGRQTVFSKVYALSPIRIIDRRKQVGVDEPEYKVQWAMLSPADDSWQRRSEVEKFAGGGALVEAYDQEKRGEKPTASACKPAAAAASRAGSQGGLKRWTARKRGVLEHMQEQAYVALLNLMAVEDSGVPHNICAECIMWCIAVNSVTWLYKKPKDGPARIDRLHNETGDSLRRHRQQGSREGLPELTDLRVSGCDCRCGCFLGVEDEDLHHFAGGYSTNGTRASRFETLKHVLLAYPAMCHHAVHSWLGASFTAIKDAARYKTWSARQRAHGNAGRAASNKTPLWVRECVEEFYDINSFVTPDTQGGQTTRKPVNELVASRPAMWRQFLADEEYAAITHELDRNDDKGPRRLLSESTFISILQDIDDEEEIKLITNAKDHNKCNRCNVLETRILQSHKVLKEAQRTARNLHRDAPDTVDYETLSRLSKAHKHHLLEYRQHLAADNWQRGWFNRWAKMTDGAGKLLMFHTDDATDAEVPRTPIDVSGLLEKFRLHVNGCFDLYSNTQSTVVTEPGGASKDVSAVIDELMINIISRTKDQQPEVIFIANDCGPLQLNQFMIQWAQFLVDHKFCKFVILGYHEQLHGKWKADSRFGNYVRIWGNNCTFVVDCLCKFGELIPRKADNALSRDRFSVLNPTSMTDWKEFLLARSTPIKHLARKYGNRHAIVVGHDIEGVNAANITIEHGGTTTVTNLRAEVQALCSTGGPGWVRMWTYPPREEATVQEESSGGAQQSVLSRVQTQVQTQVETLARMFHTEPSEQQAEPAQPSLLTSGLELMNASLSGSAFALVAADGEVKPPDTTYVDHYMRPRSAEVKELGLISQTKSGRKGLGIPESQAKKLGPSCWFVRKHFQANFSEPRVFDRLFKWPDGGVDEHPDYIARDNWIIRPGSKVARWPSRMLATAMHAGEPTAPSPDAFVCQPDVDHDNRCFFLHRANGGGTDPLMKNWYRAVIEDFNSDFQELDSTPMLRELYSRCCAHNGVPIDTPAPSATASDATASVAPVSDAAASAAPAQRQRQPLARSAYVLYKLARVKEVSELTRSQSLKLRQQGKANQSCDARELAKLFRDEWKVAHSDARAAFDQAALAERAARDAFDQAAAAESDQQRQLYMQSRQLAHEQEQLHRQQAWKNLPVEISKEADMADAADDNYYPDAESSDVEFSD